MKKNILFSLLVIYIFISFIWLINILFYDREIYIKDVDSYTPTINTYKEKINNVKNEECQIALLNMLNRINDTHFTNNVTLEKYYKAYFKDHITIMNYYEDVISRCNIKNNQEDYNYLLASLNYPYQIRSEYLLKYEVNFKDINNRKSINKTNDNVGSYTTKYLEILVLGHLIDEVNL